MATENPTPLSAHAKHVALTLEAAVMRALARKPADRYQDVAAFIAALEQHRLHPRRDCQRWLRASAAALLLGVAREPGDTTGPPPSGSSRPASLSRQHVRRWLDGGRSAPRCRHGRLLFDGEIQLEERRACQP
jgi:hypothetical protein